MSSKQPIITVDHVSKHYRLRKEKDLAVTFIKELGGKIVQSLTNGTSDTSNNNVYVALNDISFSVEKGESVGIIGKNGSGKSTLLRILAAMTEPTHGSVSVRGKSAALFSLNAGFNMELAGLQNIYLICAINGLSREETEPLISQIIEFSAIENFIGQPVRTYSSGMRARLGFSIMFHILPEIVFIDEALSVGDIAFRQKCIDRLTQINKENDQTILFVSHSIGQVKRLCKRVIWIHESELLMDGKAKNVIQEYKTFMSK